MYGHSQSLLILPQGSPAEPRGCVKYSVCSQGGKQGRKDLRNQRKGNMTPEQWTCLALPGRRLQLPLKTPFEGSFHYKQILLPCHRKAGKEPNQNRLETIPQEELLSKAPLQSGWCPRDFSCSGCSPRVCASCRLSMGGFVPADRPGRNGFLSLAGRCWAYPAPCMVHYHCFWVMAQKCH